MAVTYQSVNITGAAGGGGSNPSVVVAFNNTSSWVLDGTEYKMTVLEASHGMGNAPQVQVFERVGVDYIEVSVVISINTNGDITLIVNDAALRFEGRIIIGE